MAYGLRYVLAWQAEGTQDTYKVNVYFKDYSGNFTALTASKNPFVLKALGDDNDPVTNPIKATAATLTYRDQFTQNPISNFFSEDDTFCRVDLLDGSDNLLWSGFTVLSDCAEDWLDFSHDVSLSCSDDLALLKDVTLSEAFLAVNNTAVDAQATLLYLITTCLKATGLSQIFLDVFLNVYEDSEPDRGADPTACSLAQTIIGTNIFMADDGTWSSCWDVLTAILTRFGAKLTQANGSWQIIRLPELFLYANDVPGTRYDLINPVIAAITLNTAQSWGFNQPVHMSTTPPQSRIWRSWQFAKETFNYKQPTNIPLNKDLRTLGPLISQTIVGTIQYSDYQLASWSDIGATGAFIRVETDTVNKNEIQRYIHLPYPPLFSDTQYVASTQFLINAGDKFTWAFDFRSGGGDTNFDVDCFLGVKLFLSPTLYKTLTRNGTFEFDVPIGNWATFFYGRSHDFSQWQSVSSDLFSGAVPGPDQVTVPDDGYLEFRLYQLAPNHPTTIPAEYKNFSCTIYSYIQGSNAIIGQTHIATRTTGTSKQKDDITILIDDSPKFSISGAMFTDKVTYGTYRTLTASWHRYNIAPTGIKLGEIITRDKMAIRKYARMIFDGTFRKVTVGFMGVISFPEIPGKVFIWGIGSINYGTNIFTVTLWEVYASTDSPDPLINYGFAYLYNSG
jgi:hypothetical protein